MNLHAISSPAPAKPRVGFNPVPTGERERLRREVAARYRARRQRTPRSEAVSHATWDTYVERIVRCYADLASIGYSRLSLESLRTRHLHALVKLWREGLRAEDGTWLRKPLNRGTAQQYWLVLRAWAPLIGKAGLVPDLDAIWPAAEGSRVQPLRRRAGGRTDLVDVIDEEAYRAVLAAWRDNPRRRVHYWVIRAMRELGLTYTQALELAPVAATARVPGYLVVKGQRGRDAGVLVALDTDAKRQLAADLCAFVSGEGRTKVGWPVQRVPTLEQARRKVSAALSAELDRLGLGSAVASQGVSRGLAADAPRTAS